jgi:hypothetical protein
MSSSRRAWLIGTCKTSFAVAWAAAGAGCANFGSPHTLVVTNEEIAAAIAKRFPLQRRVLALFDLTLLAPVLSLQPARNRLTVQLSLRLAEPLRHREWQGHLQVDAALRWSADDQTLRLAQVQVQDLVFDESRAGPGDTERLGASVIQRLLEGSVLYRLSAEAQARLQRLGVTPSAVLITERGVEFVLAPVPPDTPHTPVTPVAPAASA